MATPPTGTININSGSITFTLLGSGFNTVYLAFSFDSDQVGTYELQPPAINLEKKFADTSGSFDVNFTLQAPSGQELGNLQANSLVVTPADGSPATVSGTSLVTWDSSGNILSQYQG